MLLLEIHLMKNRNNKIRSEKTCTVLTDISQYKERKRLWVIITPIWISELVILEDKRKIIWLICNKMILKKKWRFFDCS